MLQCLRPTPVLVNVSDLAQGKCMGFEGWDDCPNFGAKLGIGTACRRRYDQWHKKEKECLLWKMIMNPDLGHREALS